MIRVVLDTNVLVSAHLTRNSKAEKILYLAASGIIEIYLSPQIFPELEATLLSPKLAKIHKDTPKQVRHSIKLLKEFVKISSGAIEVDVVKADPGDNKIIACAIESQAKFIISGDHHLIDLGEYEDIRIMNPDSFLKLMAETA
jgi:uncharacterized protein